MTDHNPVTGRKSLVVYGPPGCGKSLDAKRIARALGLRHTLPWEDHVGEFTEYDHLYLANDPGDIPLSVISQGHCMHYEHVMILVERIEQKMYEAVCAARRSPPLGALPAGATPDPEPDSRVLYGPPGAVKYAIAGRLAKALGLSCSMVWNGARYRFKPKGCLHVFNGSPGDLPRWVEMEGYALSYEDAVRWLALRTEPQGRPHVHTECGNAVPYPGKLERVAEPVASWVVYGVADVDNTPADMWAIARALGLPRLVDDWDCAKRTYSTHDTLHVTREIPGWITWAEPGTVNLIGYDDAMRLAAGQALEVRVNLLEERVQALEEEE